MERFSLLLKDPRLRVRAMTVVIFALGVLFSVLIVAYSQEVLDGSRRVARVELPLLARIADLRVELARQEASLYETYATGERARIDAEYAASAQRSYAALNEIEQWYGGNEPVPAIRAALGNLDALARRLRDPLAVIPGGTHPVLVRASEIVRELHADLDVLARLIERRVSARAGETQERVGRMAQLAILFAMAIFLVAVFVGYYINAYLRSSVERRRLAVFAERNPNPVMRLALDGEIIYANAAAHALARRLGGASVRALLPEDLKARLARLRGPHERYETWSYERETLLIECGVHFLPDLGTYHAYLADVTERRRNEDKLVFHAYHHALTGLPNRRMFEEVVDQTLVALPEHGGTQAAVLMIGVDRFKVVSDTLGHAIADQLAQAIASRLTLSLQESDDTAQNATLYHFENDCYAVFLPAIASSQTPAQLAEKLLATSTRPLYVAGREFFVSFSIGIVIFPLDGRSAAQLVKNADSAMQGARRQGGNGLRLYEPEMNAMATHWLALENHLRHAIERDELQLYYQPQVDVRSGRIVSFEALLRWQHPQWGMLAPKDFVRLAEESGMIDSIGAWALREACAQNRRWRDRGLLAVRVAVNLSGRQFHREQLAQTIAAALAEAALPPDALEVEITESIAMHDVARTATTLGELKDMGVKIAIDDFGTGFSSLAYLKRFPIDKLKVDQSFVGQIVADSTDAAIVRAIITLGHALKLRVGAEGVATPEQLARLKQYECDEAQGELYSHAAPAHEVERWLLVPDEVAT